jgi:hypothetical protein
MFGKRLKSVLRFPETRGELKMRKYLRFGQDLALGKEPPRNFKLSKKIS